MPQLMYFWQYPTTGVGTELFTITVDGGRAAAPCGAATAWAVLISGPIWSWIP